MHRVHIATVCLSLLTGCSLSSVFAQDHAHHHADESKQEIRRPRVYLDKSPRIVEYQLRRLDNTRLLLVETRTDDPKYLPVFKAILLRPGMARKNREEALAGIVAINKSDAITELLNALQTLDPQDKSQRRVARELSMMLLSEPPAALKKSLARLSEAAASENPLLQAAGMAALIVAGESQAAFDFASRDDASRIAWLTAVTLLPSEQLRDTLRPQVVGFLGEKYSPEVRRKAIQVLPLLTVDQGESFRLLAEFVRDERFRTAAVRSLLGIPHTYRDPAVSAQLTEFLVKLAESTDPSERTTDAFLDAMQLADELLRRLPPDKAIVYRDRMRAVTVRVVRIHTVEEEMRYDTTYFVVEAGRPVQVVLINDDLMPHNLVITRPGKLKEVALAGAALGTTPGKDGKLYVPDSPDVLYATNLVNAGQREALTFNAPQEAGEYPYVCTFPRHWLRMYGVMLVVPDIDEWQRDPFEPRDPLGNTRSFVRKWTMNDFPRERLDAELEGRDSVLGARLFKEATCASCHQIRGQGGRVGPDLTDVLKRFKGDRWAVLREMLDPSYKIDPKYAVKIILDVDGRTTTGIVKAEDDETISVLTDPEAKAPKVIRKEDIEEIIPSTTSMMPKALLDKFTRDEILEILHYITSSE